METCMMGMRMRGGRDGPERGCARARVAEVSGRCGGTKSPAARGSPDGKDSRTVKPPSICVIEKNSNTPIEHTTPGQKSCSGVA
jgi:hypothetical protein